MGLSVTESCTYIGASVRTPKLSHKTRICEENYYAGAIINLPS